MRTYKKESRVPKLILAVVIVVIIVFGLTSVYFIKFGEPSKIGVIPVSGEITDFRYANIAERAMDDPNIKAVVIRINSPGGTVNGCFQAESSLSKLAEEKPVVANIEEYGASGAYLIASAADYVYARDRTVTAGLGVLSTWVSYEDYYENKGIKYFVWKTGKQKDVYAPWRKPTEEENKEIQRLVENLADELFSRITTNRPGVEAYTDTLRNGDTVYGSEALKMNLVDNLGIYRDAVKKSAKLAGIEEYDTVNLLKRYYD